MRDKIPKVTMWKCSLFGFRVVWVYGCLEGVEGVLESISASGMLVWDSYYIWSHVRIVEMQLFVVHLVDMGVSKPSTVLRMDTWNEKPKLRTMSQRHPSWSFWVFQKRKVWLFYSQYLLIFVWLYLFISLATRVSSLHHVLWDGNVLVVWPLQDG